MVDDPEPITDPESEPRPETISDPPTEFRKRSVPNVADTDPESRQDPNPKDK